MTKHRILRVMLVMLVILITGCSTRDQDTPGNTEPTAAAVTEPTVEPTAEPTVEPTSEPTTAPTEAPAAKSATSEYSLRVKNGYISLKSWDNEVNFMSLLGEPRSQKTEELSNADTLTGSFLKTVTYDGLQIELFSPKGDGEKFWIMTMEVSGKGYSTSKGIQLGSTVEEVKGAYPAIQIALDGRTDPDNCKYVLKNEQDYNTLEIEVKAGKAAGIKLYHSIP